MFMRLLLTSLLFISINAQAGICTREYAPVCGQLPQQTQTFSNRCMMKDAGAAWLSDGECPSSRVNAKAKDITLTVAGHDAACVAAAPMRCLQVKEEKGQKWLNFYSPIEGFTFTRGVEYVLLVRTTPITNPPMDSSDTRYELVSVVSRKPAQ
jgi:Domain of unknown function (DUF4377)/Kazal-type serine protease inhibitor domain